MMTVGELNLAHRAVNALEDIAKGIAELRKDICTPVKREVKPRHFEVGHSSLLTEHVSRPPDPHQWRAVLSLLDAIDAVYLTKDNTYGDLDSLVAEKMHNIKAQFPKEQ